MDMHAVRSLCSGFTRRRFGLGLALGLMLTLAGCSKPAHWHGIDITGSLPPLSFTMTRANDGRVVTAADYRGKVVMLYFGYTFCPDICPTTLSNMALILKRLGPAAKQVRFLFVTVDPKRDTIPVLKRYVEAFGPDIDGLRGTPDAITALARRYRLTYSVHPATATSPYTVSHSAAIYVFDQNGRARLLMPLETVAHPDLEGSAADLERLIKEGGKGGWLHRLLQRF